MSRQEIIALYDGLTDSQLHELVESQFRGTFEDDSFVRTFVTEHFPLARGAGFHTQLIAMYPTLAAYLMYRIDRENIDCE